MKKIVWLFICIFTFNANATATVIDFDSLETQNNLLNIIGSGVYTEDGFTITGTPMYFAGQSHQNQYAGSAGLHLRAGNALITLTQSSSKLFSIESMGLSILRNGGVSTAVIFTGFRFDGSTISQSFQPTTFGFTDFVFNSGFTNLTSLIWNQGCCESNAHQFDNINVAVPEPLSMGLFTLGIAGIGFMRKKKKTALQTK